MSDWSSFENEKAYTDLWRGFLFEDEKAGKLDATQRGYGKNISYRTDDIIFLFSMPNYASNFSTSKARQAVRSIIKKYKLTKDDYKIIVGALKDSFSNITQQESLQLSEAMGPLLNKKTRHDTPTDRDFIPDSADTIIRNGVDIYDAWSSLNKNLRDSLELQFVRDFKTHLYNKGTTIKDQEGYRIISLAQTDNVLKRFGDIDFVELKYNEKQYFFHNFYIMLDFGLKEENEFFLAKRLGTSDSFTLSTDSPFIIERSEALQEQEQEQPQNNQIVKNDIALLIKSMMVLTNPSEEVLLTALRKIENVIEVPEPEDDSYIEDELSDALQENIFANIIDKARSAGGKVGQFFNRASKNKMGDHFKLKIKTLVGAYLADKVLLELGLINKSQFLPGES